MGGDITSDSIGAALTAPTLAGFDEIVWSVPSLVLTVPGLLIILAVMAQMVVGAAWLPLVRRKIGPIGLARLLGRVRLRSRRS